MPALLSTCRSTTRRRLVVGAALLVGCGLGAPAALAAVSAASTAPVTYFGCVRKVGGALRVVAKATTCATTERRISWNSAGPPGAPGLSAYRTVTTTVQVPGLRAQEWRTSCPAGTVVLGGGASTDVPVQYAQQVVLVASLPVPGSGSTAGYYSATVTNFRDPNTAGTTVTLTVRAVCAAVAPGAVAAAPAEQPPVVAGPEPAAQRLSPR